jgi:hypothetical protein
MNADEGRESLTAKQRLLDGNNNSIFGVESQSAPSC